ncbi:MAG: hypothetical protein COB24_09500 [Hyphomicrobiales bacterium]|nr:MAG: hypothetical protein COB24_09500 [Hyphomicrobiales bacterium]
MNIDKLNWNDLRYFLEVSRKGRLLSASKALGVNHTTVARRINALEESLQIKLFEQDEYGFHLTTMAEKILPLAQQIEDLTELTKERVQLSGQTLSGNLRIGAPDGFGNSFFADKICQFTKNNPDIIIKLVAVPSNHDLIKREVDLTISLEPIIRKDLLCKKLTDYRLFLYTSKKYIENNNVDLESLADIEKQPFTSYISDLLYTEQLNFNHLISKKLNNCFQASTIMSQYQFILSGGGFGVLPFYMANNDEQFIKVLPNKFSFIRTYWLVIPVELNRLASVRGVEKLINQLMVEYKNLFLPNTK